MLNVKGTCFCCLPAQSHRLVSILVTSQVFAGVKQQATYKAHAMFGTTDLGQWSELSAENALELNEDKEKMVTFSMGKDVGQRSQFIPFYLCICVSVCGAVSVTSCHCCTNSVIFLSGHQLSHKYL